MDRDSAALRRGIGLGILGVAVGLCVFLLSYANGGFDPTTRSYAGIAAWWMLGVAAAIGIGSALAGISRLAFWAIGLLAAFSVWTLISIYWAADAERAFDQFDLILLYVAVLAIAVVLARRVPAGTLIGGTALGLTGVAGVALVSRLFPSTFGIEPGSTVVTPLAHRLSFPVGYWDGLGIEVALAYPLLFAIMTSNRSRLVRAVAVLPLPVLAAVMYLTSSRGAFVAAGVAMVAYLVLTPRRWAAAAAIVVAGASAAVTLAILVPRKTLVRGTMDTARGVAQGHQSALLLAISCVGMAVIWLGCVEVGKRMRTPSRRVGQVTVAAVVLLVVAAVFASHPVRAFDQFRSNSLAGAHGTYTTTHLLSSSGSGRWQFWGAAISEFRAHPLAGGGAGSWQSWWLQHGSLRFFTQNAHSVYLEALAELGIIGFLLLVGAVLAAIVGAVRAVGVSGSAEVAAAAAAGITFFAASAYDWIWQLAGIGIVGVGMLGVALGTLPSARARASGRLALARPALAVVAVAAIIPQVVVLAAGIHLRDSQAAFRAGSAAKTRSEALAKAGHAAQARAEALFAAGKVEQARSQALAAKAIEPWAASPYAQLGLIQEAERNYDGAARSLQEAISRSSRDWSLWLIAARIETERGKVKLAQRDLAEARLLNPRSPVFKH